MSSLVGSQVVLTCSALLSHTAHPPLASDGASRTGQLSSRGPGWPIWWTLGPSRLVRAVLGRTRL